MSDDYLTPFAQAALDWERRPRDKTLAWYEEVHKRMGGFVFATPAFYVIGRPVQRCAARELVLDPTHVFDFADCDAWFIFHMHGEVRQAWNILPWSLPWMGFTRHNDPTEEIFWYETARLRRLSGV